MNDTNWPMVRILHDEIAQKLTMKQYLKWTCLPSGVSRGLSYQNRFTTLSTVTSNRKLLKLANAALFEISRGRDGFGGV